jgi:hypothetical protein
MNLGGHRSARESVSFHIMNRKSRPQCGEQILHNFSVTDFATLGLNGLTASNAALNGA